MGYIIEGMSYDVPGVVTSAVMRNMVNQDNKHRAENGLSTAIIAMIKEKLAKHLDTTASCIIYSVSTETIRRREGALPKPKPVVRPHVESRPCERAYCGGLVIASVDEHGRLSLRCSMCARETESQAATSAWLTSPS